MNRTLIIAEAGVNHNGSLKTAKELVDLAYESGADIVKFQTAKLESLVSRNAPMAAYQKKNTGVDESQKAMLEKLLLSFEEFEELAQYCEKVGIKFLSTPFDIESIHFLNDMQDIWKIPSGEITNYPYLVEIAKTHKKIILSTGMAEISEIEEAIGVLNVNGANDITILHCTTEYPAPYKDVNLRVMKTLKDRFGYPVGYSDHTSGIEVALAAVALGATVIEKHFTLDRNLPGPDRQPRTDTVPDSQQPQPSPVSRGQPAPWRPRHPCRCTPAPANGSRASQRAAAQSSHAHHAASHTPPSGWSHAQLAASYRQ